MTLWKQHLWIAFTQLLQGVWRCGNEICGLQVPNCYKEHNIVEIRFWLGDGLRSFCCKKRVSVCSSDCRLTTYVTPNWRLDWRDKRLFSLSQFLLSLLSNDGISWGGDMYLLRYRKTFFSPDLLRCFWAERDKSVLGFHLHIPPHLVHIFFSECGNMRHMDRRWISLSWCHGFFRI